MKLEFVAIIKVIVGQFLDLLLTVSFYRNEIGYRRTVRVVTRHYKVFEIICRPRGATLRLLALRVAIHLRQPNLGE